MGTITKCEKCGADIPISGKFCQSCGNKVFSDQAMTPDQIDLNWLSEIMTQIGYKREPDKENENEVFGTHENMHNLALSLRKDFGIIVLQSLFVVKKAGWGGRTDQYMAINKANGAGNFVTWFYAEDNSLLGAYSFVPLVEHLTKRDVIFVIEKFNDEINNGLNNSGLMNYLS